MRNPIIFIPSDKYTEIVHFEDIVFCKAEGSYTQVILKDRPKIISPRNLSWFEKIINAESFFRVHKSYYVNLKFVRKVFRNEDKVCLSTGENIPLSRYKKKLFWQKLRSPDE
ncbi:LytR/AlgR family response regulator transcription factor [Mariniphaga sediminis]|uniref:LytR/AlgR family response regulator transcription factor n=1 Tax=Mariniphaga sediminis TaxID=1628158 RepID=UPI003561846A